MNYFERNRNFVMGSTGNDYVSKREHFPFSKLSKIVCQDEFVESWMVYKDGEVHKESVVCTLTCTRYYGGILKYDYTEESVSGILQHYQFIAKPIWLYPGRKTGRYKVYQYDVLCYRIVREVFEATNLELITKILNVSL